MFAWLQQYVGTNILTMNREGERQGGRQEEVLGEPQ